MKQTTKVAIGRVLKYSEDQERDTRGRFASYGDEFDKTPNGEAKAQLHDQLARDHDAAARELRERIASGEIRRTKKIRDAERLADEHETAAAIHRSAAMTQRSDMSERTKTSSSEIAIEHTHRSFVIGNMLHISVTKSTKPHRAEAHGFDPDEYHGWYWDEIDGVQKYSPDQERDENGRFASGSTSGSAKEGAPDLPHIETLRGNLERFLAAGGTVKMLTQGEYFEIEKLCYQAQDESERISDMQQQLYEREYKKTDGSDEQMEAANERVDRMIIGAGFMANALAEPVDDGVSQVVCAFDKNENLVGAMSFDSGGTRWDPESPRAVDGGVVDTLRIGYLGSNGRLPGTGAALEVAVAKIAAANGTDVISQATPQSETYHQSIGRTMSGGLVSAWSEEQVQQIDQQIPLAIGNTGIYKNAKSEDPDPDKRLAWLWDEIDGVKKYSDDQPRDDDGRFASGGEDAPHIAYIRGAVEAFRQAGGTIELVNRTNEKSDPHVKKVKIEISAAASAVLEKKEDLEDRITELREKIDDESTPRKEKTGLRDELKEAKAQLKEITVVERGSSHAFTATQTDAYNLFFVARTASGEVAAVGSFRHGAYLGVGYIGSFYRMPGAATAIEHEFAAYAAKNNLRLESVYEQNKQTRDYHLRIGRTLGREQSSEWSKEQCAEIAAIAPSIARTSRSKASKMRIGVRKNYNPDQPRDSHGRFGSNDDGEGEFKDRLGRCYELAGKYVGMHPGSTLVHGSIQGFGNPRIGHAWVKLSNGSVWEPITNSVFPKEVFDSFFNAQELVSYSRSDVADKTEGFGHWGPWDEAADADNRGIVPPIKKYSPDQPRDEHGRFGEGSGDGGEPRVAATMEELHAELLKKFGPPRELDGSVESWIADMLSRKNPDGTLAPGPLVTMMFEYQHFGFSMGIDILGEKTAAALGVDKDKVKEVMNRMGELPNGKEFNFQTARDKYVVDDDKTLAMNRALRGGRAPSQTALMTDWAISQVTVQATTQLTRDALLTSEQHEQLQVGTRYTDKGFQSTELGTGGSGYGSLRLKDYPGTSLVINDITVPPGVNVGPFYFGEVVLPRNTTLEITDRQVREDGAIMLKSRVVLPEAS